MRSVMIEFKISCVTSHKPDVLGNPTGMPEEKKLMTTIDDPFVLSAQNEWQALETKVRW